jgi:hypothetical protein
MLAGFGPFGVDIVDTVPPPTAHPKNSMNYLLFYRVFVPEGLLFYRVFVPEGARSFPGQGGHVHVLSTFSTFATLCPRENSRAHPAAPKHTSRVHIHGGEQPGRTHP